MEPADLLAAVRNSLAAITAPRFFETERGFQGQLLVALARRVQLREQAVLEQEYQKRQHEHGLNIRPDIIIHEPFDPARHKTRLEGNYAVVELKLSATAAGAKEDFEHLAAMINVLGYPLGIFINIGATATYEELIPQEVRGQIVAFAVTLLDGKASIVESWQKQG